MSFDYRREYDSAQCPVCFHHHRVRRDGLLAKHRNRLTRQPCQGGGTNPSVARRPLLVNGEPIPKHIGDGSPGDFARYCGETDPKVLAFLDAEGDDDGE